MKKLLAMMIAASPLILAAAAADAACPVGKKEGDTWCEKGMEWKCERCGSEYCPIITGKRCVKDDAPDQAWQRVFRGSPESERGLPIIGTRKVETKGEELVSHGI